MVKSNELRYEYTKQSNGSIRIHVLGPGEVRKKTFGERFRSLAKAAAWAINH